MRLLTHNSLRNNSKEAKGKGYPLAITVNKVRVDETPESVGEREVRFVKGLLGTLDWNALTQAATALGIPTLPPQLTEELAEDENFLKALYSILMNVHLVEGVLTCPVTGREFPVTNEIPNMMLDEDECEPIRM